MKTKNVVTQRALVVFRPGKLADGVRSYVATDTESGRLIVADKRWTASGADGEKFQPDRGYWVELKDFERCLVAMPIPLEKLSQEERGVLAEAMQKREQDLSQREQRLIQREEAATAYEQATQAQENALQKQREGIAWLRDKLNKAIKRAIETGQAISQREVDLRSAVIDLMAMVDPADQIKAEHLRQNIGELLDEINQLTGRAEELAQVG